MNTTINKVPEQKLSDEGRRILEVFTETIPKLNQLEREKLISFGEGMLFMKNTARSA